MDSVQTMRWILVNMSAAAAVVAIALGYWTAGLILLLGVAAHTTHWYLHKKRPEAAAE
ncbi:hypothetical protein [Euzebya tangerina]|uniref:hypothetical protein n=1 Tax=Euzebya tangerina TaxID=591198 RepID=UPI0013C36160|nr:hypothetical protein [Euzebya tangerina]